MSVVEDFLKKMKMVNEDDYDDYDDYDEYDYYEPSAADIIIREAQDKLKDIIKGRTPEWKRPFIDSA